ncbi:Predicted metal-dependent peptidase [Deinococcus hopiensis KR-140]|uniref:Predicted metal-dependent peptidase n=1 Tax=Deinococcus hopiensis KR-140 TaxID=695939 RepID=A0A1W1UBF9_9DEIO|nr:Predicted metal-dependent peptidase [Deinococcus hopiensis KR-140]
MYWRPRPLRQRTQGTPQAELTLELGPSRRVTVNWPEADRLIGNPRRGEEAVRPFLPAASPVLVSPCGWRCTPQAVWGRGEVDFLLPQPQAHLSAEALQSWQRHLTGQAAALTGSRTPLLRAAALLLAGALRERGHANLNAAVQTGDLQELLPRYSAALLGALEAVHPPPENLPKRPPVRPRLQDNLNALSRGDYQPTDVEPWGSMLWPWAWHPAFGLRHNFKKADPSQPVGLLHHLHAASSETFPWELPEVEQGLQRAATVRQVTLAERLVAQARYRHDEAQRQASVEAARTLQEQVVDHRRTQGIGKELAHTAALVEGVLRGEHLPGSEQVYRLVTQWLTSWAAVDQLLPELRHVRAGMRLVLDPREAARLDIRTAALRGEQVIVNLSRLGGEDAHGQDRVRILARMVVHRALGHAARGTGRNALPWSTACVMIAEAWFDELQMPPLSRDVDPAPTRDADLETLGSAEAVYAELLRRLEGGQLRERNLSGTRSRGLPDLIGDGEDAARGLTPAEEEAVRDQIARGLEEARYLRGLGLDLGGGLMRELRAVSARPVPWRPALLEWAQPHYPRPQRRPRWNKLARRESSDPRMPRPSFQGEDRSSVLLAVLIDASASMEDATLAEGLGAIENTCGVLGIGHLRLIACDTVATDHGLVRPWQLREAVTLTGGGGTDLQDGVDLLERLATVASPAHPPVDPRTPLLILTDGLLWAPAELGARPHAWLMPPGARLPFRTKAPTFTIRRD